jgi:alpha-glucuronidase
MLQQHTNTQEQISACTLLWNLSFDQNVRKSYHDHKRLNEILNTIANTTSNDELRRAASGCLCTLGGGPTTKVSSTATGNKEIMISYNHDVKQVSKQIKDYLANDGYDVWSKKIKF